MTAEIPRTKPNIMITARLLLMPVLRSVELKPVPWARACIVLSASSATIMPNGRSRATVLVMSSFILLELSFVSQRLFRRFIGKTTSTEPLSKDVGVTQNATKSVLRTRHEQNVGYGEAAKTPRTLVTLAARNSRAVAGNPADHFFGST